MTLLVLFREAFVLMAFTAVKAMAWLLLGPFTFGIWEKENVWQLALKHRVQG